MHLWKKDYLHAFNVWNTLKKKIWSLLKTDVLLLADVFEKFINICLEHYGLDPCHYFSSSGLSCDGMPKMTEIELELISDIDMYLFIEEGMKWGICYIAKRFSKANNKYMESYDDKEAS